MTEPDCHALVSTAWLEAHLSAPDVRVVDASWFFPTSGRDGRAEFDREHIPGAVHFDINAIADTGSPLPHMVPDAGTFSARVGELGLGDGHRIVTYDRAGAMGASRVWWMFRLFGHEDVSVLDGGLVKWLREGRPVTDMPTPPRPRVFTPFPNAGLIRDKSAMQANLDRRDWQVVDARSALRFKGQGAEPWPHVKVGHIPGSHNMPWEDLIDPATNTLRSADAIRDRARAAGLDLGAPIVASCGSGVSACVLALALFVAGNPAVAVYDGSWAEWGLADDTPAEQ
ncbi:MAG: sulfurtransferase [Telmatospirillum sp.]|nr:sulfurtransferase [Telmatospirillum sp.]